MLFRSHTTASSSLLPSRHRPYDWRMKRVCAGIVAGTILAFTAIPENHPLAVDLPQREDRDVPLVLPTASIEIGFSGGMAGRDAATKPFRWLTKRGRSEREPGLAASKPVCDQSFTSPFRSSRRYPVVQGQRRVLLGRAVGQSQSALRTDHTATSQ